MEALANIARQNTTVTQGAPSLAAPAPTFPPPSHTPGAFGNGMPQYAAAQPQANIPFMPTSQPAAPPVNVPALPFAYPPQAQPGQFALPGGLNGAGGQAGGFPSNPPPVAPNVPAVDPNVLQQQLVLIQTLAAQGIPLDKIATLIAQMNAAPGAAPQPPQIPQPIQNSYTAPQGGGSWQPPRQDESRDRYRDPARSPNHQRNRSRSPARHWDNRDSPRGRGNDNGYDYGRNSPPGRGRGGGEGRAGDYRQRSPVGRRGQSPLDREPLESEKWIEFDPTLENGTIRVLSRTLFVGGVT
jgi:protein NRD1